MRSVHAAHLVSLVLCVLGIGWGSDRVLAAAEPGVVVTGRVREINGARTVQAGLFGVHATPLDETKAADWGVEAVRVIETNPQGVPVTPGSRPNVPANIRQVVECFWDRYQPARLLLDQNWRENLQKLGKTYANNAKTAKISPVIEFWNEPYLNWANRPGVNYDPAFYESANRAIDAPMTIKGWDKPTEHLVWAKKLQAVDEKGNVDYLASAYVPQYFTADGLPWEPPARAGRGRATQPATGPATRPAKDGDTFVFRNTRRMTIRELWWGRDVTQKSYFSARQNGDYYRWMLAPFAQAVKEANPEVRVLAGWGCLPSTGGYAMWRDNLQPAIDDAWRWIDGVHEHHYGGDTRYVAGDYMLAYAYGVVTYQKPLVSYNTEAGGMLDPQRPDTPARPNFEPRTAAELQGCFTYTLRDILYLLDMCPDKAMGRAAHMANAGDEWAFRLLKDLRGTLVYTTSSDADVWCVASLPGEGRMTVVLFNDSAKAKELPVTVASPGGAFTGATRTEVALVDGKFGAESRALPASGLKWTDKMALPGKAAVMLAFTWDGPAAARPAVVEREHFSPALLTKVEKGTKAALTITVPTEVLKAANGVRLRLCVDNLSARTGALRVNGKALEITRYGPVQEWELDPKGLTEKTTVEVECFAEPAAETQAGGRRGEVKGITMVVGALVTRGEGKGE